MESEQSKAKELTRDKELIDNLYTKTDDDFARACFEVLRAFGFDCTFVGASGCHDVDILVKIENVEDIIVIDCKRKKKASDMVSSNEAEEVVGKGKRYNPKSYVTIGYPNFSKEAIKNISNTKITLLTHNFLASVLLDFWEGELKKSQVLNLLSSADLRRGCCNRTCYSRLIGV